MARGQRTPPEVVYRIMASWAATKSYKGTAEALGLAVSTVKKIVDEHKDDEEFVKLCNEKAQAYYNQLIKNGYQNVASELTDANYEQAEKIRNKWAKMDKTATRPYLYTLGQKYGMSNSDVDKIIGWDSATGQVSIGGKTIGTPDAVVDGASYWSDTSVLDNAFKDYISRSGSTYNTGVNNAAYN